MRQIYHQVLEQPKIFSPINEEVLRFFIRGEVIRSVMAKLNSESLVSTPFIEMKRRYEVMEAEIQKKVGKTYSDEVKQKCVELFNAGKSVKQIQRIVKGPGHKAIQRYIKSAKTNTAGPSE